jgi:hypothetical protein
MLQYTKQKSDQTVALFTQPYVQCIYVHRTYVFILPEIRDGSTVISTKYLVKQPLHEWDEHPSHK